MFQLFLESTQFDKYCLVGTHIKTYQIGKVLRNINKILKIWFKIWGLPIEPLQKTRNRMVIGNFRQINSDFIMQIKYSGDTPFELR